MEPCRDTGHTAFQALVQPCHKGGPRVGPRQVHIQLCAAPLCRSGIFHGSPLVRFRILALDALQFADIECRVGVRHRGIHGATLIPGPLHHSRHRKLSGRSVLPRQARHRGTRLHAVRLEGAGQHSGLSGRPGQRGREPVPWQRYPPPASGQGEAEARSRHSCPWGHAGLPDLH